MSRPRDKHVINSIKELNLRNFDCLLGGRDDWFLALAHDWHIHDLVDVLGLRDLNCFLFLLDRGDLSVCHYRHVHDLLGCPLLDSLLQRLDFLLSGCCADSVRDARVPAVWLFLSG